MKSCFPTKEQRGNEKLHVHRIKRGKKSQDPHANTNQEDYTEEVFSICLFLKKIKKNYFF